MSDVPRPLSEEDGPPFWFYEAFNARDFDAMAGMIADDVRFEDRRPGLSATVSGRDAQMEQIRVIVDLGMYQSPNTLIAKWDARLFLFETPFTNRDEDAPIDVDTLMLVEYGPDGRIGALSIYEPTDAADALVAMKDRRRALEGTSGE